MADYYPLLARALDALPERTNETRRAVYDRARGALTAQLRSLDPPLSEMDIARERLALDDAVDRVERDYAERQAAEAPQPPDARHGADAQHGGDQERPFGAQESEGALPEALPPSQLRPTFGPDGGAPESGRAEPGETTGGDTSVRDRPRIALPTLKVGRRAGARPAILGLALALAVGLIAVAAWLLRDQPGQVSGPVVQSGSPAQAPPSDTDSKFGDRVAGQRAPTAPGSGAPAGQAPTGQAPGGQMPAAGQGQAAAPPSVAAAPPSVAAPAQPGVAVAQRAVLFEENATDPQNPKVATGRTVWRLDSINGGQGQPLETVVRATIELPGSGLSLQLLMRRNLDTTLPASHTVELTFTPGDSNRAVRDVGVLQLKNEETVRGTPIAALPVPVKDNVFLIGLSDLKGDIDRNTDLLLHRNWIDLPIRFVGGQRAVLSFEKGISGEQVMADAFRQWAQSQ